jgi:hypothetical protein
LRKRKRLRERGSRRRHKGKAKERSGRGTLKENGYTKGKRKQEET